MVRMAGIVLDITAQDDLEPTIGVVEVGAVDEEGFARSR